MLSIGRGGARKLRRLIRLLAVGWRPPYVGPSGAGLPRGARRPIGLVTPSRVAPHRGGAASEAPGNPSAMGSVMGGASGALRVCWPRVGPWPTSILSVHGQGPPPRGWRVCRGRAVFDRVDTIALVPSRCCLGWLWGVWPVAVAGVDSRWRETAKPQRLPPAPDEHGWSRLW